MGIDQPAGLRRQKVTRGLCWIAIVCTAVALCGGIALVPLSIQARTTDWLWAGGVLPLTAVAILGQLAMIVLWMWRRGDRCSERLFPLIAGLISEIGRIPELPDYRAPRMFGSYHWGAITSVAFKGTVNCIRCGHKDGATPDHVVTAR